MYPQIDSSMPVEKVVELLVAQVKELVAGKNSLETAISSVVRNRYGGRFAKYMGQVRKSMAITMKPSAVSHSPVRHAFLSGQHASLAMERIQDQ